MRDSSRKYVSLYLISKEEDLGPCSFRMCVWVTDALKHKDLLVAPFLSNHCGKGSDPFSEILTRENRLWGYLKRLMCFFWLFFIFKLCLHRGVLVIKARWTEITEFREGIFYSFIEHAIKFVTDVMKCLDNTWRISRLSDVISLLILIVSGARRMQKLYLYNSRDHKTEWYSDDSQGR